MNILFFDTESTDLSAAWGRILCASFAYLEGDVFSYRGDSRPHKAGRNPNHTFLPGKEVIDDSRLVRAIKHKLEEADIIVSWNGILHDIPLLNARLRRHGFEPVRTKTWPEGSHIDLMYYASGQSMKVGGKSLDRLAKYFELPDQKTPLDGTTWQRAAVGLRSAMDQVVEHCEADVRVLRAMWPILAPGVKKYKLPLAYWWQHAQEIEL